MFEKMMYNLQHDIMFKLFVEDYYKRRTETIDSKDIEGFTEYLKAMCSIYGSYILSQIEHSFIEEGEDFNKYMKGGD